MTIQLLVFLAWFSAGGASGVNVIAPACFAASGADAERLIANPSFEQADDEGLPRHWGAETGVAVVEDTATDGQLSLRVRLSGKPVMLRQDLDAEALAGKRLTFRGAIRTESLDGQAVLFVMVDGNGKRLFMDDMRQRAVNGTTEWAYHEITVPPLPTAEQVSVGVLALGSGVAWFDDLSLVASTPSAEISMSARAYLNEALDLMQKRALLRDRIDWPDLRANVLAAAVGARTPTDTHAALQYALTLLGDPHTSFKPASPSTEAASTPSVREPAPVSRIETELLDARFGYLHLPGFPGGLGTDAANAFATHGQKAIRQLADQGACGWVLDLRGGAGGNMWPILASLGPLLEGETVGACVDPDGERGAWWYRDGRAGVGETVRAAIDGKPVGLSNPRPPVAILTSGKTASAGEALTLAFSGQANTRRFGVTTAGLATANGAVALSDGSLLILTLCAMEDRAGGRFPNGIPPDVATDPADALEAALEWLGHTEACRE